MGGNVFPSLAFRHLEFSLTDSRMYFADNHIIGNPLSQGEILYTSGQSYPIVVGRPPCRPTIAQDSSMRANTGVRPYKDCVFPLGNSAETWSGARQPQFNQWILKAFPLLVHGHEIDKYAPMCYNPHIQAIRRKLKTTLILTISHDATRRKH